MHSSMISGYLRYIFDISSVYLRWIFDVSSYWMAKGSAKWILNETFPSRSEICEDLWRYLKRKSLPCAIMCQVVSWMPGGLSDSFLLDEPAGTCAMTLAQSSHGFMAIKFTFHRSWSFRRLHCEAFGWYDCLLFGHQRIKQVYQKVSTPQDVRNWW